MHYSADHRRWAILALLGSVILGAASCVPPAPPSTSTTTTASTTSTTTTTMAPSVATTTVLADNATTTAATPDPVVYGGTVVFTASVTAADGSTPAGSISWTMGGGPGPTYATQAGVVACVDTPLVDGVSTCSVTPGQSDDPYNYPPEPVDWIYPIDATATFVPAGPSYLGSSAADSTSKVHVGAMTPTPQTPYLVASGQVPVSIAESDDLGRTLENQWRCSLGCGTTNTVIWDGDVEPPLDTLTILTVCPAGADPISSFECQRPNLSITFMNKTLR